MNHPQPGRLPLLPLLLYKTPPGLELILRQAGIPYVLAVMPESLELGRFVITDGTPARRQELASRLTTEHRIIDLAVIGAGCGSDPFAALIDTRPGYRGWGIAGYRLLERVSRVDRARIRFRILDTLRAEIERAGGLLASLGPFPHPYRSAFNLRLDLDEPVPADYLAMAKARRPLNDCSTHFVCTSAYGRFPAILDDLRGLDSHSHGHYHVVSRDPLQNERNLQRADDVLRSAGIQPTGYAGPEGRWNLGLDSVMQGLEYEFSGEFQLGFDDLPFWPWLGDRFSRVLQIPVHPVCEGLFLDAGAVDGRPIADHLCITIERKIAAGEPAFIYGHPERRLGKYPVILERVAETVEGRHDVWRTTQSQFARWWLARSTARWRLLMNEPGILHIEFENRPSRWIPALKIERGHQVTRLAVQDSRFIVSLGSLEFCPCSRQPSTPEAPIVNRPATFRGLVRQALDWETVTPTADLPDRTISQRARKWLRSARAREALSR